MKEEATTEAKYVTLAGAATILGVNRKTLLRWIAAGKLEGWKSPGGHWHLSLASIDRLTGEKSPIDWVFAGKEGS